MPSPRVLRALLRCCAARRQFGSVAEIARLNRHLAAGAQSFDLVAGRNCSRLSFERDRLKAGRAGGGEALLLTDGCVAKERPGKPLQRHTRFGAVS